jgi:hypothetical protein
MNNTVPMLNSAGRDLHDIVNHCYIGSLCHTCRYHRMTHGLLPDKQGVQWQPRNTGLQSTGYYRDTFIVLKNLLCVHVLWLCRLLCSLLLVSYLSDGSSIYLLNRF